MRRLGQHFLRNQNAIQKTIASLTLKEGSTVIEIGPGHGELTEKLNEEGQSGKLIAIEKDPYLAEQLQKKFENEKNIEIIQGDALKLIPSLTSSLPSSYFLVGNIPYYITGHLLRIVGKLEHKPECSIFMVQKEVAERVSAKSPEMNRLAASVQFWATPKMLMTVPRKDFSPPPEVDSAILSLETKPHIPMDPEKYYGCVKILFAQPRKTILNNLASRVWPLASSKEEIESLLKKINLNPNLRPQDLSLEEIIKIALSFRT